MIASRCLYQRGISRKPMDKTDQPQQMGDPASSADFDMTVALPRQKAANPAINIPSVRAGSIFISGCRFR